MPNYTPHTIPLYILLTMLPHIYSAILLSSAQIRYNNVSPRSSSFQISLTTNSKIPPAILRKYERCRAAHSNLFENSAFFVGAVVLGCAMRLDAVFMNSAVALYFLTRLAWLWSYVTNEDPRLSFLRSVLYTAGMAVLTAMYVRAGNVLVAEGS